METAHGRLRGVALETGVFRFSGIPFAAPPVGALRFADPQPPEPWPGIRPAGEVGPAAPQLAVGAMGPIGRLSRLVRGPMAEDCLTLNVWTPGLGGASRPVLVWFHGGAFVLGAGSTFLYDAAHLAASGDVVVVSVNYRLGALGFLDLTRLTRRRDAPSNLGLKDQIAALHWVRDTIAAFGGAADQVTVFGESAGAMSVGTLLAAAPHLFRRAILQSGAAANVSSPAEAAYVAAQFLDALEVDPDRFERLREIDIETILKAQRSVLFGEWRRMGRLPWQPSVDGTTVPNAPVADIARGRAGNIDILLGTNLDEWKLFTAGAVMLRGMSHRDLETRIAWSLRLWGIRHAQAAEVRNYYLDLVARRKRRPTPYEAWVAFRSDQFFRMPARDLANRQSRHTGAVFLYRFDQPIPAFRHSLGACHAAEVPLVFGTHRTALLRPLYLGSRRIDSLSRLMQSAWLSFARTGRPEDDEIGPWPEFEPEGDSTRALGSPETVLREVDETSLDLWLRPAG